MYKQRIALTSLAGLFLFMGCVPAKIESNMRPGYTKKLDNVYILLSATDPGALKFYYELSPALAGRLNSCSVINKIHIYDILGLDEKKRIKAEIDNLKPNHILTISLTAKESVRTSNGFGGYHRTTDSGASFELLLQEAGGEDVVWKAILETKGSSFSAGFYSSGSVGSPEVTADKILECLRKDGLITLAPIVQR